MVLAADAGNTHIKLAVFKQQSLRRSVRLSTKTRRTSEEAIQDILNLLQESDITTEDIEAAVVSTVAPETTEAFIEGIRQLFLLEPLIVGSTTKTGIKIKTDNPAELGADRLVNAAAAFQAYGGPILVIDFGTATTYDVISEQGEFLGGIIAPGVGICAGALWEKTSKLPEIAIERPHGIMGTNTVNSMQAGVYYGYLGQLEYLVRQLKKEQATDFKVIATGGLSAVFKEDTDVIDIYEPELTLKGLNYIYRLNRG
jgi:type III pantothenate kinase